MDKYADEYDDEEKEILAAFEAGELKPIRSDPELLELHRRYADTH